MGVAHNWTCTSARADQQAEFSLKKQQLLAGTAEIHRKTYTRTATNKERQISIILCC